MRGGGAKARHRGEVVQMYVRSVYAGRGRRLLQPLIAEVFWDPALEQLERGVGRATPLSRPYTSAWASSNTASGKTIGGLTAGPGLTASWS